MEGLGCSRWCGCVHDHLGAGFCAMAGWGMCHSGRGMCISSLAARVAEAMPEWGSCSCLSLAWVCMQRGSCQR